MKKVTCCGAIILHNQRFLLIKHNDRSGGHWYFPKGHMEEGETQEQTAAREILEETGLQVNFVPGFKASSNYIDKVNSTNKTAIFFLANAITSNVVVDNNEVVEFRWLDYQSAHNLLTYDNAKDILTKANEFIISSKK